MGIYLTQKSPIHYSVYYPQMWIWYIHLRKLYPIGDTFCYFSSETKCGPPGRLHWTKSFKKVFHLRNSFFSIQISTLLKKTCMNLLTTAATEQTNAAWEATIKVSSKQINGFASSARVEICTTSSTPPLAILDKMEV